MSVEAEKLSSYDSIDEIGYLMGGGGREGGISKCGWLNAQPAL